MPWHRSTAGRQFRVVALPQLPTSSSSLTPHKRGTAGQCGGGVSYVLGGDSRTHGLSLDCDCVRV